MPSAFVLSGSWYTRILLAHIISERTLQEGRININFLVAKRASVAAISIFLVCKEACAEKAYLDDIVESVREQSLLWASPNEALDEVMKREGRRDFGDFIVVGKPVKLEMRDARKVAPFLANEGLRLVLISQFSGLHIPGYDGVILDREGSIVGNFSLKGLYDVNNDIFRRIVIKGAKKLSAYMTWEKWVTSLFGSDFRLSVRESPKISDRITTVALLGRVFGVGEPLDRQQRLLAYVYSGYGYRRSDAYRVQAVRLAPNEMAFFYFEEFGQIIEYSGGKLTGFSQN